MSVRIADANTMLRIAHITLAAVILLGGTQRAVAEESTKQKPTWEFLVASGSLIPTGAQRDVIQHADLTAAQLAYVIRPDLALTATLGWIRSRDIASADKPKLDIFTYDLGAEVRSARWNGGAPPALAPSQESVWVRVPTAIATWTSMRLITSPAT